MNNTFGERHSYLIPAPDAALIQQACAKALLRLAVHGHGAGLRLPRSCGPDERVLVAVDVSDAEGLVLTRQLRRRAARAHRPEPAPAWLDAIPG